ncbi:MAG: hypothetical protein HYV09_00625 [Deltaproteobacteria bacterium]|nr:hypothetical protein [Deltaproteobacteria bacterium]
MSPIPASPDAQYNTRILRPLVAWVSAEHGSAKVSELVPAASIDPASLDRDRWISQEQFERFLEGVRALVPDDEAFKQACVFRIAEAYGPMRYLLWASSPASVYAQAEKTYSLVSTIGAARIVSSSRTALHVQFASDKAISRLNCLVRQAQTAALPTLWGLPPATLRETQCIAHGDERCEYHLRWFERRRWYPSVLGATVGAVLAAIAARLQLDPALSAAALPALGAAIGFGLEMHRTNAANVAMGIEQTEALRLLAEEEAGARHELLELHMRQRSWDAIIEHDAAERAHLIKKVVERIDRKQKARDSRLQAVSHDLRSPLAVVRLGLEQLAPQVRKLADDDAAIVEELRVSIERMGQLLRELMQVTSAPTAARQLTPQPVEIDGLCERLRRRARAMVHGRDIRANAFRTREAPDSIEIDPLLVDRITDNLLSNAAKYTERGSIVIEVDGVPGFLIIKVSDSGRGIAPEHIERAFRPGATDESARMEDSYGLGLSVVVQLLAQIGGHLDVMSKPDVGTTFWAYLPTKAKSPSATMRAREAEPTDDAAAKVVRIRDDAKGS